MHRHIAAKRQAFPRRADHFSDRNLQLRHLARSIYPMGPRPLFEMLLELDRGADLHATLERYATIYLSDARKIVTSAIEDVLERTGGVGWHPAVYFNEPGHALHGRKLGAIIAVMTDPVTAEPTGGISRTYLDPGGRKVGKAKTLGSPAGIIRLSEDADVLEGLHIAEGLETALAGMAIGLRPMWATGSTALMRSFPLLGGIEAISVVADNDANGAGERAAGEVASRWREAGKETRIIVREGIGDINDALAEGGPR